MVTTCSPSPTPTPFAVTAYQAAWLKCHHPLEFFVALMNSQPMGFYPVETIKEDARRFGVPFLNPCVNLSGVKCRSYNGSVLLGLGKVKDVGEESAKLIVEEREQAWASTRGRGPGAEDGTQAPDGALPRHGRGLRRSDWPTAGRPCGMPAYPCGPRETGRGRCLCPRETTSPSCPTSLQGKRWPGNMPSWAIYPRGHVMEFVRPTLSADVLRAADIDALPEGQEVLVAGWPVARQHPRGMEGTVFVTIEDETGDVQLIVWPRVFARYKRELGNQCAPGPGVWYPVTTAPLTSRCPA